ncbi:MAG: NupC/NupG family nucleoside CNT transporter [Proteobacteria bacterium]|nr:MAG: NupC/NupG family nucleoside CNT transporter [Pseudomonadota bacterium]
MDIIISTVRGIIAIFAIISAGYLLSTNRKHIQWRIPLIALVTAIILINLILHSQTGHLFFEYAGKAISKFISFSFEGADFVFGTIYSGNKFSFLFVALIPLIFFGSFMSLLYHYGIVQKFINFISIFLVKVLKLSGVEATGICSTIFLGQSEGIMVIGPYVRRMSDSELFMMMTCGMSCVAGTLLFAYASMGANLVYVIAASVVSAPCAIVMAKIIFPENASEKEIIKMEHQELSIETHNAIDALGHGATNGAKVAIAVAIMLLAFIAFIGLLNAAIGFVSFHYLTLDKIFAYIFTPIAYVIGVPTQDVNSFSTLFGMKTCFNEFVAYADLKKYVFTDKGFIMVCFALTGFANISSVAMQIGVYGAQWEGAKAKVAKFGLRALAAAAMANLLAAALAGMFFY